MTNTSFVEHVEIDGETIQKLIYDKLGPAVEGERLDVVIMTLITFAILLMKPSIESEELKAIVMRVSELLMLALTDAEKLGEVN